MKHQVINKFTKGYSKKKDKAYFASKSELLSWVRNILHIEIKGIEQTVTGAIFCQLLDAAHPGTIRMNKVNWKAKLETEYISNFKIFQQGLSNNNIDKTINISRLSKGKNQELIELLQWLYGYHLSLGVNSENYNATKKRNGQTFVFSGDKSNNINIFNNKNLRDDLSRTSSCTDLRDLQVKNNLKYKANIKNLNKNLRGNNFHTKFNYQNQIHFQGNNSNLKKNKKNIGNFEKNSNKSSSNHSLALLSSTNSVKTEENITNKNINDIISSPFTIIENPEENLKENEDDKLNNIIFEGIGNADKKSLLEIEKNDGNNIHDLKILIRKLRVNNIIFKKNLGFLLSNATKERNFFLNKLKDIEYLYFNPIIKNSNESKNNLLKRILESQIDSTVKVNDEGIASILETEKYSSSDNSDKKLKMDKINIEIKTKTQYTKKLNEDNNIRKNSQKISSNNSIYSKENKKKRENSDKILKEEKNKINFTQPLEMKTNNNENKIISFSLTKDSLKNDIIFNRNNSIISSLEKKEFYNISSHILNDSLHFYNNENTNPNCNNKITLD